MTTLAFLLTVTALAGTSVATRIAILTSRFGDMPPIPRET